MAPDVVETSFDIGIDVASALAAGGPVVALESTIISHGMPYPQNVETALRVEACVRQYGATPATIAILGGRLKAGLTEEEIQHLGKRGADVIKCSRRDLPFVVARRQDGATTVAATMFIAERAGIDIFATGGIGGVHRDVTDTHDVSADLEELARSNVVVVCAGIKSILDIGRTLEFLETKGVPVAGFQTDTMPAFYSRDSDFLLDHAVESATDVAIAIAAKRAIGMPGGLLIAVPPPEEHAMDRSEIDAVIAEALAESQRQGISGKRSTPFLLARINKRTDGRSLKTNIELVLNNARVAAEIACALADLRSTT